MRTWNTLSKSGPAAAVWLAGLWVLGSGCAEERVVYVPQVNPAPVAVPEAPPLEAAAPAPAPPPAPVVTLRSAVELDTMLAPIALYPDPLLAQILPAATLPAQVVLADRYVRGGGDLSQVDAQPWDNSLKALARYPAVLQMLDDNLAWTTDLGQAFLNQPADMMDSVQRLRAKARAVGNLVSTPQETVVVDADGVIDIVPATPEVIYVPVYQPEVVYVQAPPAGQFYVSFGAGLTIGAWLNHDCDWHQHTVIVWHRDHPRPVDWWYHPSNRREGPTGVNSVTVASNTRAADFTVWQPRTRGTSGDRGWGQPRVQVPTSGAAQPVHGAPPSPPAKRLEPGKTPPPSKAPSPRSSPATNGREKPPTEVRPAPQAPPAAGASSRAGGPAAPPHPVMNAPSRVAAAPPKGVESSRATREASARGQQSRESISRPAAAAPRPAEASSPRMSSGETRKGR